MPRRARAQRFLFDPHAVLYDPAYMAMSPAARGCYFSLFCHAWLAKEPGVLPADDGLLRNLAGCSAQQWRQVREQVEKAWGKTDLGAWQLKAMSEAAEEQDRVAAQRRAAANSRWHNNDVDAKALRLQSKSNASAMRLSSPGSGSVEAPNPHPQGNGLASPNSVNETRFSASSSPPLPPSPDQTRAPARPPGHGPACACELCWAITFPGAKT